MSDIDDELKKLRLLCELPLDHVNELAQFRALTAAFTDHARLTKDLGISHTIADMFADQQAIASRFGITSALDSMGSGNLSSLSSVLETVRNNDLLPRSAIGAMTDFKRLGFLSTSQPFIGDLGLAQSMVASFEAKFRLPDAMEAARLAGVFNTSIDSNSLGSFTEGLSVQAAMNGMNHPWFDPINPLTSLSSFVAIQQMGTAIGNMPTFDTDLTSALRLELGDWRQRIEWPSSIFHDMEARSSFYATLGVNVALTDMPVNALQESLRIAGVWDVPPPLVLNYDFTEDEVDEEEEGFVRTNEAHDRLQRLETQLRQFIDQIMTVAAGHQWPKHRMPPKIVDAWWQKKLRAEQHIDKDRPLIAYADFTEYELVICKRDNWKYFEPYFNRPESVRESLQRLYPIRIDTMHARIITQDDELFLLVECKRLMAAMGRKLP